MTSKARKGVYAAAITPIAQDGTADLAKLADYCAWLIDQGLDGVAPTGTTGEGPSVSFQSRLKLPYFLAERGIAGNRAIIGTGCPAADDAVALTRACMEGGYPNVLVLPPYYLKNVSDDGLFSYYARIIEAVGSEALRIYLYHFPAMSAVPISVPLIQRLKAEFGPIIAGLKDSSGEYEGTKTFANAAEDFDVFPSNEGVLRDALARGMGGVISATTNAAPALARRAIDATGGEADRLQGLLSDVRQTIAKYPLSAAIKELHALRSGDESWRAVFPPLTNLSKAQAHSLIDALKALPEDCSIFDEPPVG